MTTIGVLGGRWRATVTPGGSIEPWDGSPELNWFIAADDRWYTPAAEPTVRQHLLDNTPVVETRVRVPNGDAVHRVWCVADSDGLTMVEIENASSLPFAVAFDRGDLLSSRPPTDVPIQGIDLPAGSVMFPVGHRSSIIVALPHTAHGPGTLPERLPSALQVASGWTTMLERAGRLILPDEAMSAAIARLRAELLLSGPTDRRDDAVAFLIDTAELVRLGEPAVGWVADVAEAVSVVARRRDMRWETVTALDAAAVVLAFAGEDRALRDLARLRPAAGMAPPSDPPDRLRLAWFEQRLARRSEQDAADLLSGGLPPSWLGADFEVHSLPVGQATTVSYAVRWHGHRPAVLWELIGPPVRLGASVVAPAWSTTERSGEALWPAPPEPSAESAPSGNDVSFS